MHHEDERHHEQHGRHRHGRHRQHLREEDQYNRDFRSRWEEPRPFNDDDSRRRFEQEEHFRNQRHEHHRQEHLPQEVRRHMHGFSDDHPREQEHNRNWRRESEDFNPRNQHANDRWQQDEYMPRRHEERGRRYDRRDQERDERGW